MTKVTLSVIKADVGSVAGHTTPHPDMMKAVRAVMARGAEDGIINDFYVTRVGDDINIFMTHYNGENNRDVHSLAWDAFMAATDEAKKMHLYGAGQDLLTTAFSGNVKGQGPGSAEMTFEERKSEPIVFFMADKTEPSAYSLPLAKIFMDPFTTTGLVIDPRAHEGFRFEIVDVVDSKKVVMETPDELHDILALLGDTTRYAIKRVFSKDESLGPAAVLSTDKLNITAGKYVGKDDPVAVIRAQSGFPAVGEILQPFIFPHLVAGWMRGSHYGAFYPCSSADSNPTYFDGPPRIVALGMHITNGKFQGMESRDSEIGYHEPVDYFAGSEWDMTRHKAIEVSIYMRQHGPFMPAIVAPEELEYTTRPTVLKKLEPRMEDME